MPQSSGKVAELCQETQMRQIYLYSWDLLRVQITLRSQKKKSAWNLIQTDSRWVRLGIGIYFILSPQKGSLVRGHLYHLVTQCMLSNQEILTLGRMNVQKEAGKGCSWLDTEGWMSERRLERAVLGFVHHHSCKVESVSSWIHYKHWNPSFSFIFFKIALRDPEGLFQPLPFCDYVGFCVIWMVSSNRMHSVILWFPQQSLLFLQINKVSGSWMTAPTGAPIWFLTYTE